ncbi:redoxin domain-containing protein [Pedobacter aquae]|uniref:Redoxin domain-containing protein n=1 Tax=Pedobacter aquae TaxID=2605747 RepID=A0A5C0VP66_9SPHI|nr:redoxin domain-containing protein [Pedobacter aquae]QEK53120.1 redoxin domain-containing protein [Pedobacter aquae]
MKFFWSIILSVFLSIGMLNAQEPVRTIPSFKFFQLSGTSLTDKNIPLGKLSIFSFFDITCSHCQETMQLLAKEHPNLSHVNLYLVTMDRKDGILKFMNVFGANLLNKKNVTILQDLNQEFIAKFYPRKYPSVFLFDKNKKLLMYQDEEAKIINLIAKAKAYK